MKIDRKILINEVNNVLSQSTSSEYSMVIANNDEFINAVQEDVEITSAWEDEGSYNEDDIRLAIGRVIMDKFGIEY